MRKSGHRKEKGYVLVLSAAFMVTMMGMVGLGVDLGRMYVARNELQSFSDSAAIAAALQLDGTSNGIANAQAAVNTTATTMKWDMGTKTISTITVDFAKGVANAPNTPDSSSWSTNPASPSDYRFVRVKADAGVPLIVMQAFLTMMNGSQGPGSSNVEALSVGGQALITQVPVGLLPFSPIAPSPTTAPSFGFQGETCDGSGNCTGHFYTLRYPSNGAQNKGEVCQDDQDQTYWQGLQPSNYGFWGEKSAAAIRGEIIDDAQSDTILIGEQVPMVGGLKDSEGDALATRVNEDTDATSATYGDYIRHGTGNGRRVIGVPINSGPSSVTINGVTEEPFTAIGIGAFFLLPSSVYSGVTGSTPICAEYIGPWVQGRTGVGASVAGSLGETGGYEVRLIQ